MPKARAGVLCQGGTVGVGTGERAQLRASGHSPWRQECERQTDQRWSGQEGGGKELSAPAGEPRGPAEPCVCPPPPLGAHAHPGLT